MTNVDIGLSPLHLLVFLVIAAFWATPVVVLILAVRHLQGRNRPDPRAILAERLARGEIGIEQFHAEMRALGEQPGAGRWGGGGQPPAGG